MTREDARDVAAKVAHAERRRRMEAAPLAPNLHSLVEEFCREDPEAAAWVFVDSNETLTRRDVFDRITRLASSLCRIGVGKGTHVAIALPNVSAFPITWLALACLGAVMVPVNTRHRSAELAYCVNDADAEYMVIDARLLRRLESVADRPPVLTPDRIIVLGSDRSRLYRSWGKLLAEGTPGFRPDWPVAREDLMNIQYTSGTTGFPKGCIQTQLYWLIMGRVAAHRDGLQLKRILIAQPFFYMDPQWLTLMAIEQRGTTFVAAQPSVARFMDWVHRYQIDFCIF